MSKKIVQLQDVQALKDLVDARAYNLAVSGCRLEFKYEGVSVSLIMRAAEYTGRGFAFCRAADAQVFVINAERYSSTETYFPDMHLTGAGARDLARRRRLSAELAALLFEVTQ